MKDKKLKKQYDKFSNKFAEICYALNKVSRTAFYKTLGKNLKGKKLLDLACGDGRDMQYYAKLGAQVTGLDTSFDFIAMAKKNNPIFADRIFVADFENTKLPKNSFDIIASKYAVQTSKNLTKVFKEAHRILKPGGMFLILVTHPLRQFMERKTKKRNYFKQKVVNSVLFYGSITVKEPTHMFTEYISSDILEDFSLEHFSEGYDPASTEKVDNSIYPGFMILKYKKR